MRRAFKVKVFDRWARKAGLQDIVLHFALLEMERGLIDAELGGGLFKKRVALPGKGKRGSARVVVACRHGGHWFLLVGFSKNAQADLSQRDLEWLKAYAKELFGLHDGQLSSALALGELKELKND
jgi:hypothetical protein